MNVLRYLVLPWFFLFILTTAVLVFIESFLPVPFSSINQYAQIALAAGILLCLFANFKILTKVGIWLADSLPRSVRMRPWTWILRALLAIGIAALIYFIGQFQSIPLMWQGMVVPVVFTLALFTTIWCLMSLVLSWSSRVAFSRFTALLFSLPIFATVPITALFLGHMVRNAYNASRADFIPNISASQLTGENKSSEIKLEAAPLARGKSAQSFQALVESGKPCPAEAKEIYAALSSNGPEDNVYWAIKAIKCSEMKSTMGLPKLAKLMTDHPSARVRVAAIRAMPKFGPENVRRLDYLLVKRINEREPLEIIEAVTTVLSHLGESEGKMATNRLKTLLENPRVSSIASKVLVENVKRADLVADYVSNHLASPGAAQINAIQMICSLPPDNRKIAESSIHSIVSSIKTGEESDPAVKALTCLGEAGFEAVRQEVLHPHHLSQAVAAHALAAFDNENNSRSLETTSVCARNEQDENVRLWCSKILGKVGASALPEILDLLKSDKKSLKESGKNALNSFDDAGAKLELLKIRRENSGWMANKNKIQIASAVSQALNKIEAEEQESTSQHE